MTPPPDPVIMLDGAHLVPDPSGALWWPSERALIVADLHLEKGSSLARRGQLVPPYDSAATLERLAAAVEKYTPRTLIALGDSFHDHDGAERLGAREREMLKDIQRGRDFIWIAGNHDPAAPQALGGTWCEEMTLNGITLRHEPYAVSPCNEENSAALPLIVGHFHPVACITVRGRTLRRRVFATDGQLLVLPAFGAYTGGLDIRHAALRSYFSCNPHVYALGNAAVYPFAAMQQ